MNRAGKIPNAAWELQFRYTYRAAVVTHAII